jgi:hypothetical protein
MVRGGAAHGAIIAWSSPPLPIVGRRDPVSRHS